MNWKDKSLPLALSAIALIVALFVAGSLYAARLQSIGMQTRLAEKLARNAVKRTDGIRENTFRIFSALSETVVGNPCSVRNIALMRALNFRFDQVVDVGYVDQDRLRCSSYGDFEEGIAIGPPSYSSPSGAQLRLAVELPYASGTPFVTTTHRSGYTAVMRSEWSVDDFSEVPNANIAVGAYSTEAGQILFSRGRLDPSLMAKLDRREDVSWFDGKQVVALSRSPFESTRFQ